MLRSDVDQVRRAIGRDDEDITVYGQVFAIAAADVQSNGPWREGREEGFYYGPGL